MLRALARRAAVLPSPLGRGVILLTLAGLLTTSLAASEVHAAPIAGVLRGAAPGWSHEFTSPGLNGGVTCAIDWNGLLIVAGGFEEIDDQPYRNIAAWDGARWSALGSGCDGVVYSLAIWRGELIAAGHFNHAGEVSAHVARWNGSEWLPLSVPGSPDYQEVPGTWWGAMFTDRDTLYIAGSDPGLTVWRWSGQFAPPLRDASGWAPSVWATTRFQGHIYVGGSFVVEGEERQQATLARWDHDRWSLVGGPGTTESGRSGTAYALLAKDDRLWVGGYVDNLNGEPAPSLAAWDGEAWTRQSPPLPGDWDFVGGLVDEGTRLVVAGTRFEGERRLLGVASLEGGAWRFLDRGLGSGYAIGATRWRDQVCVVGEVHRLPDGRAIEELCFLAGDSWSGIPIGGSGLGIPGVVNAFARHRGHVVVAGGFSHAGSTTAPSAARWNDGSWEALHSSDASEPEYLRELVQVGDDLFARGVLDSDPTLVDHVVRYDGTNWQSLGSELEGRVSAIENYRGELIAAGDFKLNGHHAVVVRWDGSAWHRLDGDLVSGHVYDLLAVGDTLYAAGSGLNAVGGYLGDIVQRYVNGRWWEFGSQLAGVAFRIARFRGRIAAAGFFHPGPREFEAQLLAWSVDHWVSIGGVETTVGGSELAGNDSVLVVGASIPSLGLKAPVVFDGTRWSGLNDRIAGISALDVGGGCLWVGGLFDNVAGIPSRHVARWDEPATAAEVSRLAATRNGDTVRLTWQALGGDEAARLSLERQEGAGAWHHIGPPTFRARESNEYLDPSATADTLRYRIRQVYGRFTDPLFTDPIDAIARGAAITNYSIERRERDAVLWWALQDPEQRARVAVLRSVDGAAPVTLAHDLTGTSGSYADSTAPGTRLEYWLELRSGAQPAVRIGPLTLTALPVRFEIAPNPARGDVLFSMQTPLPGRRTIRIYDAAGRLVATPIDAIEPDGPRVLSWKHSLAAGLYFARASIGGREFTRRIVILN